MLKLRLEVQEIFDAMAVGLITSATGHTYSMPVSHSISIDVSKNQYTYSLYVTSEMNGNTYKFLVIINNDYMRVYNDGNNGVDFTTVTHYFASARRAVSKEEK